ncbi:MAG: CAP domain-containing protein [Acidimicrobiia bacterium]|nr:CAP domain-containing protein [Acidimicrobiia bacterium]
MRTAGRFVLLGFAAVAVTVLLSVSIPAPAAHGVVRSSLASQLFNLINQDRAQAGLGPLQMSSQLNAEAQSWTNHMISTGDFQDDPGFASCFSLPGCVAAGSNVAEGFSTVQAMNAALMASPPHRANILGDYNLVGVGVAAASNGALWCTEDFALTGGVPSPGPHRHRHRPIGAASASPF